MATKEEMDFMMLGYQDKIETEEQLAAQTNRIFQHYGCTDPCFVVGITGDCGFTCPVFKRGECEHQSEMDKEKNRQIESGIDLDDIEWRGL